MKTAVISISRSLFFPCLIKLLIPEGIFYLKLFLTNSLGFYFNLLSVYFTDQSLYILQSTSIFKNLFGIFPLKVDPWTYSERYQSNHAVQSRLIYNNCYFPGRGNGDKCNFAFMFFFLLHLTINGIGNVGHTCALSISVNSFFFVRQCHNEIKNVYLSHDIFRFAFGFCLNLLPLRRRNLSIESFWWDQIGMKIGLLLNGINQ